MAEKSYEKIKAYAYRLLNYRPRSKAEIVKRLKDRGYSQEAVSRVVSELSAEGLIDDKNFARLWARMRLGSNPRSLSVIKFELTVKGIDAEIIEEVLAEIKANYNEEEIVSVLIKKRLRSVERFDEQKQRQRLLGYISRRGFSNAIAFKVLDEIYRDS